MALLKNTIINGKLCVNDIFINGGPLTFTNTNAIQYKGSKATYSLIRFIDNTGDAYGNGIAIGGGGKVAIGAGESAGLFEQIGSGGDESLYLSADGNINLYSNANNGLSTAKHMQLNADGTLTVPGNICLTSSSASLHWQSNTYHQRIINIDDSTSGTDIFQFQQSTNGGSSFDTQASVTDDGGVVAKSYIKIGSWKVTESGGDLIFTR